MKNLEIKNLSWFAKFSYTSRNLNTNYLNSQGCYWLESNSHQFLSMGIELASIIRIRIRFPSIKINRNLIPIDGNRFPINSIPGNPIPIFLSSQTLCLSNRLRFPLRFYCLSFLLVPSSIRIIMISRSWFSSLPNRFLIKLSRRIYTKKKLLLPLHLYTLICRPNIGSLPKQEEKNIAIGIQIGY